MKNAKKNSPPGKGSREVDGVAARIPAVRVARGAALLGLALALAYFESFVVILPQVPGVKLGLANAAVLLALYTDGYFSACAVGVLRVFIAGLLFNGLTAVIFGLSGAMLSLLIMAVLRKSRLSGVIGVSAAGGVCHNIGQIFAARIVLGSGAIFYYLPALILAGMAAGLVTGLAAWLALRQLKAI